MELAGILKASPVQDISSENSLGHQRAYRQLSRRPGPTTPDAAPPAHERRASAACIASSLHRAGTFKLARGWKLPIGLHRWSLAMPRYFFHLNTNEQASVDSDGLTFLDHQAAWEEATMACGEMIRTIDGHLQPGEAWQMEVTDEAGKLIYRLRFIAESFE
jgi:hypothetical protein